jgi:sulfur relay (sulfurtransferase) DsrF/TusC family protein
MKNKLFLILVFTVFLSNNFGYAQYQNPIRPFKKINYQSLNFDWHYTSYDPLIIGDTCDGYNFFMSKPFTNCNELIDGDYLIHAQYRNGLNKLNGTYIEKINVKTGKLIWTKYYGIGINDKAEFARLIKFDKDKNIEILSQLDPDSPSKVNSSLFLNKLLFTKRIYNSNNGELLEYIKPDFSDLDLLQSDFNIISYPNEFYNENDKIRYFAFKVDTTILPPKQYQISSIITQQSKKSNTVEFRWDHKYTRTYFPTKPFKLDDSTYLMLEIIPLENKIVFFLVDGEFNIVAEYQSEKIELKEIYNLFIKGFNPINKTLLLENRVQSDQIFGNELVYLMVLDLEAKTKAIKKIPSQISQNFGVLDWKDFNNIKICGSAWHRFDNGRLQTTLNVYNSKADSFELNKQFLSKDSLRLAGAIDVYYENEDKIVIKWREQSLYESGNFFLLDWQSSAISLVSIDKASLGILSSVKIETSLPVNLYPNPTNNFAKLDYGLNFTGNVTILNVQGQKIMEREIFNAQFVDLDIQVLPVGIFYILSKTTNGTTFKSIKMIKF